MSNKMTIARRSIYFLVVAVLSQGLVIGAKASDDAYQLSVTDLNISGGDSIVSFEIDVNAGAIVGISNMPVGWYYEVDDDASWKTKIQANVTVGAAAVSPKDFGKINFIIKKNEFGDLKFGVSGSVTTTKDFNTQNKVILMQNNLKLVHQK